MHTNSTARRANVTGAQERCCIMATLLIGILASRPDSSRAPSKRAIATAACRVRNAVECDLVDVRSALRIRPGHTSRHSAPVALTSWPADLSRKVGLELLTSDGSAAYGRDLTLDTNPQTSVMFIQAPLDSAPNQLLPAGTYQLGAKDRKMV